MKRGRLAVHADVGDAPAWAHNPGAEDEALRISGGLDDHVGAEPLGQIGDQPPGQLGGVGTQSGGCFQPGRRQVHRDDSAGE